MTNATDLTISSEYGDRNTVPADYLLDNWRNHSKALRVIKAAIAGRSGSFETPSGLVIVRPA